MQKLELMMELNRGDIVIVNLYPKKGDEVGKIRPAVIISGNDENSILDTVILLPLSTDLRVQTYKWVFFPMRFKNSLN